MNGSGNKELLAGGAQSDDELSLLDLVMFVRRHGAILLGGTLIGGVLGLAVAFALPAQWEASALILVGQLRGADLVEPGADLVGADLVEPPSRVVDRVTQKSFKDDTLKRMDVSPDESNPKASLLLNSLKVKVEKSGLVGVRVRGATPDEAARFANALIVELISAHTKIAEPTLQHWHDEIEKIDMELIRLNSEIEGLNSEIEGLNNLLARSAREFSAASLFQAISASNALLDRKTESHKFLERKRTLQEQINPERTFPTSSFGQIEVSAQPVFPKKSIFAASGLVIGLLMAVLLSLSRSHVLVYRKG